MDLLHLDKPNLKIMDAYESLNKMNTIELFKLQKMVNSLLQERVFSLEQQNYRLKVSGKDFDEKKIISIQDVDMSARAYHCLLAHKIMTLNYLKTMKRTEFRKIRNAGKRTIDELTDILHSYNMKWADEI